VRTTTGNNLFIPVDKTTQQQHQKMRPEEVLTLNWLEKWKRYGRFPWKLVLHLLVTALCTTLVRENQ
jgi:hypothetical protein